MSYAHRVKAFGISFWLAELGRWRLLLLRLARRQQGGRTDDAPHVEPILGESASLVEANAVQAAGDVDGALRECVLKDKRLMIHEQCIVIHAVL